MLNIRDIFSCKIVFELHVRCGSSTPLAKNEKTSFSYPTDRKSLVQRTGDFQFYSPNGEFYCFAVIYGFQPSDIALRQLKRRIEYHCDEVAISLLRKQKYHTERSEVYHKKIIIY